MVDLAALMSVLPVSGLEPQHLAIVYGFGNPQEAERWRTSIILLEPPAGQRTPYVEPLNALEMMERHRGTAPEAAQAYARETVMVLYSDVAESCWVNFYDPFDSDAPKCLSFVTLATWLRKRQTAWTEAVDLLEGVATAAATIPLFKRPNQRNDLWSLQDLPVTPPPKAMIEFVPGAPWGPEFSWDGGDNPFLVWRESIRPIAEMLEKKLGEPVYHFRDLQDELDDDAVHRFLVLHWCCTYKPTSPFVSYILANSRAHDVEELKSALVHSASFIQTFEMNDAFVGLEATPLRLSISDLEAAGSRGNDWSILR